MATLGITMIKLGSIVVFKKTPEWVSKLPDESRKVFEFCPGRAYRIVEIGGQRLFVLDIGDDTDDQFGSLMNNIRLESESLKEVA